MRLTLFVQPTDETSRQLIELFGHYMDRLKRATISVHTEKVKTQTQTKGE